MIQIPVIQKCSHPVRISDKTNGGYIYVGCGRCEACLTSYRSKWMQRLDNEAKSSVSVLFFTLTYDNDNIPTLTYDVNTNALYSNRSHSDDVYLDDYITDSVINKYNINPSSFPLLQNDKTTDFRLGYCCKSDVQKFIKRLRRRLDYDNKGLLSNVSPSDREIRYFITAEYGPTTHRPHYHGLLFLKHKHVARAIKERYIREAWQFCDSKNMDCSVVFSNASSYVAKYVRGYSDTPDILKIPAKTEVFYLCSRRPAIGVGYFEYSGLTSKIQHHTAKYNRLFLREGTPDIVELPVYNSATNFFFPKVYRSSSYDTEQLCNFYNGVYQFLDRESIRCKLNLTSDYNTLYSYFSNCLPNLIKNVQQKIDIFNNGTFISPNCRKGTLSDIYHTLSPLEISYGISQNRSALIKFLIISLKNNLSVYQYVENYLSFYSVRNSETMEYMYDTQNEFKRLGYSNIDIARYFYPSFFDSLPRDYGKMSTDERTLFYLNLASLDIEYSDVYDAWGHIRPQHYFIQNHYRRSAIYQAYISDVRNKNIKFHKKRKLNHIINQKNQNYGF